MLYTYLTAENEFLTGFSISIFKMKVGRLQQIEEIYHAALKISPDKREEFFDEASGADENLCREVISLLSFEEIRNDFIDASHESLIAGMFAEKDSDIDFVGKEIGDVFECVVQSIEITNRVTTAKVLETLHGETVIDYFHLLKVQDKWRIVSKLWDAEPSNA